MFFLTLVAGAAWLIFVMASLRMFVYEFPNNPVSRAIAFAIA